MEDVYSRYGSALYILAKENDNLELFLNTIKDLKRVFKNNKDLVSFFSSYFISYEQKCEFIDKTFLEVDKNILDFLKIIVKNHRSSLIFDIFDDFISRGNEAFGIKEGRVITTSLLSEEKLNEIEIAFSNKLGAKVELKNEVDDSIIGGIKVFIGEKVYDGTIKNRLETLKNNLKERR